MQGLPAFSPRSDAPKRRDGPGKGDDVPCVKCGGALDTGLECTECGHDNYEAVTGKPFKQPNALSSAAAVGGRLRRTVRPEGQKGRPTLKTDAAHEKALGLGSGATLQE